MRPTLTTGMVVFDDVDLLDAIGPYEVLLTANRLAARDGAPEPFAVQLLGLTGDPVRAYGGARIVPEARIGKAALDILVVPGAIAMDDVLADRPLMRAIEAAAAATPVVASVCTGAFLLGALGLLRGRRWTTHWEDIDELAGRLGAAGERNVRWVDEGEVVTAGALSNGMAMALHLVHRFAGLGLAERAARQLEYPWTPDPALELPNAA